jgi:hypothetical protein
MSTEINPVGPYHDRLELAFETDPDCVVLRPQGAFTPDAGLAWISLVLSHPRYAPGMAIVYDLTELDAESLDARVLREYVKRMQDHPLPVTRPMRVAFVAPTPLAFGMLRMFETIASLEVPRERAVFRTIQDARAWLGELDERP